MAEKHCLLISLVAVVRAVRQRNLLLCCNTLGHPSLLLCTAVAVRLLL